MKEKRDEKLREKGKKLALQDYDEEYDFSD